MNPQDSCLHEFTCLVSSTVVRYRGLFHPRDVTNRSPHLCITLTSSLTGNLTGSVVLTMIYRCLSHWELITSH